MCFSTLYEKMAYENSVHKKLSPKKRNWAKFMQRTVLNNFKNILQPS